MKALTVKDLIKEIKRQHKEKMYVGFLGFVENKDLTPELESYFKLKNRFGMVAGYDWVNGNDKLQKLINVITKKVEWNIDKNNYYNKFD